MNPTAVGALKSWTMWFAVLLIVFGVLQTQSPAIEKLISPTAMGWFNVIVGTVVAVLRAVTTMSLADKGQPSGEINDQG
jgi:uncharacterized membrane protein HdeD (DUF308 family)